ncbi:MAG: HAMP domain-containing histidine kinase [Cytophagales bacterium]|nr:HAMP domain-containing histidine kinase [Cytophagales bacterium]
MKLVNIANRNYIITLILVFVVGSIVGYFVLKSIVNKEFNEKLFAEKDQLIYELHTFEELKANYYLNIGDKIQLDEVDRDPDITPILSDTVMYDKFEKKKLPFRTLTFSDKFQGKFYLVRITKSLMSNNDLMKGITEIMVIVVLLLSLSLIVVNRFLSKKIWSPFHQILSDLNEFKISKPVPLSTIDTTVDEFRELQNALNSMIDKSIRDYQNLKEYTENTSHEIQTPLAIIRNKSEMLLQEPLSKKQLTEIGKIYEASGRLSRLKEGLSILTKIDNEQFVDAEFIHLKKFIKKKLSNVEELVGIKNLTVTTKFLANPILELNNDLAYILITNLLSNAIKHNVENGEIKITVKSSELLFENTGLDLKIPTEELFDRFKRSGKNIESIGLGLSLVKRITDYYHMQISYSYSNQWHVIKIQY